MKIMNTITIAGKVYDEISISKEKEEYIRLEAVDLCFALKRLINDSSALVRTAVARKKVGHDCLAQDESWRVRATVARYTDDIGLLESLATDENEFVRYLVVKRGCFLEKFIDDLDEEIASIARYQLQKRVAA